MSVEKDCEPDPSVHDLLVRRWSPRTFDPQRPVSHHAVRSLLEAARIAPSSFNEQPWRFLVFDESDRNAREQARSCLVEGNAWARVAPVLLLSVAAERWSRDGTPNRHAQHDVGLSSENLAIQATALGLAVHFMAGFDAARSRRLFGIPDGFTPMAMIAVGYGRNEEEPSPKLGEREPARRRKAIEEIAFAGRWGKAFDSHVRGSDGDHS